MSTLADTYTLQVDPELKLYLRRRMEGISERLDCDLDIQRAMILMFMGEHGSGNFIYHVLTPEGDIVTKTALEILEWLEAALEGRELAEKNITVQGTPPNVAQSELCGGFGRVRDAFLTVFAPEHLQQSPLIHSELTLPQISARP